MNKTLLKKLTEKHLTAYPPALSGYNGDDMQSGILWSKAGHDINILEEAAKELLQPRPEAIARLLKLAKEC